MLPKLNAKDCDVIVKKVEFLTTEEASQAMKEGLLILQLHLKHSNIIPIWGIYLEGGNVLEGQWRSFMCTVMPFYKDGDLSRYIGKMSPVRILNVSLQITSGLSYLHSCNVTHRDLKPENILVELNGETGEPKNVVIADFGAAKRLLVGEKQTIIGTPKYMSPESFVGEYGEQVDIFSFGCVMYHLFIGSIGDVASDIRWAVGLQDPQKKKSELQKIYAEVERDLKEALSKTKLNSWEQLVKIILATLHDDPTKRPSAEKLELLLVTCSKTEQKKSIEQGN